MALCFITLQIAFEPHGPGQGLTHFWFTHAWISAHSELNTHSGLQPGGFPWYEGRHEQTAWPFISLHWLFGPHGDGVQGAYGSCCTTK